VTSKPNIRRNLGAVALAAAIGGCDSADQARDQAGLHGGPSRDHAFDGADPKTPNPGTDAP